MKKILFLLLMTAAAAALLPLAAGCEERVGLNDNPPPSVTYPEAENPPEDEKPPENETSDGDDKDGELPEIYRITFATQTGIVEIIEFEKGSPITEPEVPRRDNYTGEWESYTLDETDLTVYAVYTPIVYSVTFAADDISLTINCTVEDTPEIPEVPRVEGYSGVWKYFANGNSVTATPEYTPKEYRTNIFIDGVRTDAITANIENIYSLLPEIPEREHYTAEWEGIDFSGEEINVNAVYTAVSYAAKFFAEGVVLCEIAYTVEDNDITEPAVPEKAHYDGKWEYYSLDGGNKEINAVYALKTYKVEFVCKGNTIETIFYTIEDTHLKEPEIPHITGYSEDWEEYALDGGDKIVNAVYTPLTDGTEGLVYTLSDNCYTISGYTGSEASVFVPPYYNDLPVKAISERAFYASETLSAIVISEGIENICAEAFAYCKNLSDAYLPDSLKTLGESAFSNCSSLEFLSVPDRITEIGKSVFALCGLRTVSLPEDLVILNETAFFRCVRLTEITIPEKTEIIGSYAFAGCKELTEVHIGKSVKKIDVYAFLQCDKLSCATFGDYENWHVSTPDHPEIVKDITQQLTESVQSAAYALVAYSPDIITKN